jgi:stage V sporulation protein G
MNLPSIKVSVWPFPKEGKIKATAKVTFGDAISICPIKIIKGKAGLFLGMPQLSDQSEKYRDVFHPCSKEAREALTEMVLQAYDPGKMKYHEFPGNEKMQVKPKVLICKKESSGFAGFASLEINGMFKLENLRLFRTSRGRINVQYPTRSYMKNGEVAISEIVAFKNDYDDILRKQISDAYSEAEHQNAVEMTDIGAKSLDELVELRRKKESKTRAQACDLQQEEVLDEELEPHEDFVIM